MTAEPERIDIRIDSWVITRRRAILNRFGYRIYHDGKMAAYWTGELIDAEAMRAKLLEHIDNAG